MSTVAASGGADLLEQYRRPLIGYCYRMLGSIHEAEDAVQDTMLRAWRALPRFEDRAGVRPWLYRIATNVCFDMMKGRARRALPVDVAPRGTADDRLIASRHESNWVEPAPDDVLAVEGDPAEQAVVRESVRLAFVAALQQLPPRQRAVLILRDVLLWHASEVAELLATTPDAINSSLRRARSGLEPLDRNAAPSRAATDDHPLLAAYIDAFDRHDVDALVRLLREDAIVEMPPFELWLQGRQTIRDWLVAVDALSDHLLIPTRANGSPAVATYRRPSPGEPHVAFAIHVLDLVDGQISAIHSFVDPTLFTSFGLPDTASDRCTGRPLRGRHRG